MSEESESAVFGYGSLILPTSLVGRFVDLEEGVDSIYEEGLGLEDDGLIREEAEEAWDELKNDLEILPVKISGFRRSYSYESPRGGAMLGAEPLLNEDDYNEPIDYEDGEYINGLVVLGLDEDERDEIASTEDGYKRIDVHRDNIEHYLDDKALEELGAEIPEHIEVYVGEESTEKFDKTTSRTRNKTYHARVLKGIEMLGDLFGEDVANEFYKDFLETTYERKMLTNDEWGTVYENDEIDIEESLEYLFDEVLNEDYD